jgi:hypothetical protein
MQLYRLRCECGAETQVGTGRAGGQVACEACGRQLAVPTLRELTQLPRVHGDAQGTGARDRAASGRWTLWQGLLAGGLAVAVVSWGLAALIFSATRTDLDMDRMRQQIDQAPFMRVYAAWRDMASGGVERDETVGEYRARNMGVRGRAAAITLSVVGGLAAAVAALGGVAAVAGRRNAER